MLSREDNELLTRVGSGTPMGDLVRRYWIPFLRSDELEPGGRVKRVQHCNWFKAREGGIDSSHISFLHAPIEHTNTAVTREMDRASFGVGAAVETGDRAPRFEVADTDYGVLIGARRTRPDGQWYWRFTQYLLPFYTMPPADIDEKI